MTMRSATRKPGPDSVWICLIDGSSHGAPYEVLKKGRTYRGDHPAVIATPEMFAPFGTADQELQELAVQRFGSYEPNNNIRFPAPDPDLHTVRHDGY